MKTHITLFLTKLATSLGLNNDKTALEKLEHFIKEQKHKTLLDRINDIRQNSFYVPDYNKPKVHTDIVILYQTNPESCYPDYEPISSHTKLAYGRPIDFGNDIKAWKKIVRLDHKKELKEKNLLQLQGEQRKEVFETKVAEHIMSRFMKIN